MENLNVMTEDCEQYLQNIKSDLVFLKEKNMKLSIYTWSIKSKQEFKHHEIKMLLDQIIKILNKYNIEK